MNDQRKLLILKALKNGNHLTTGMAESLYSSDAAGRNAIQSLEFKGIVERKAPGAFRIKRLPQEVHDYIPEEIMQKIKEANKEKAVA